MNTLGKKKAGQQNILYKNQKGYRWETYKFGNLSKVFVVSVVFFSFVPCQTRKVVMWSDVWLRAADSSGGKTNVRVGSALDLNTSPVQYNYQ